MTRGAAPATASPSLRGRILAVATLTVLAFLGATGASLDQAFREASRSALEDRLEGRIYALLGALDLQGAGEVVPPRELSDPALATPESGAWAWVRGPGGAVAWRSPSALGVPPPPDHDLPAGSLQHRRMALPDGTPAFTAGLTVRWELPSGEMPALTVQAAEHPARHRVEVAGYRRTLWSWLLAAGAALLLVQGAVLVLLLRPLRALEGEVTAIEAGERERIGGRYPVELQPLVDDLNALVAHGQASLARSRGALDALAHSLKTPLAVLEGQLRELPRGRLREDMAGQLAAARSAVDYQLQRAALGGRRPLTAAVEVAPMVERLARSLEKVHGARGLALELRVPGALRFRGDPGDLTEILGNLLDNAFKWAGSRVRVSAAQASGALVLAVEDDGPGLPEELAAAVTGRGVRLDPAVEGHGVGLAVVRSIVTEGYGGELRLIPSDLGGLRAEAHLPL